MATRQSFKISEENLIRKVKEIIAEGNATSIAIQDKHGKELMRFSLTVGVVGALLAPILAAIGALAAVVGEYTITVDRKDEATPISKEDAD